MSTTTTAASMLPTPPNSPSSSPGKPVAIPITSAAALTTKLHSQPSQRAQAPSPPISPPRVTATSPTNRSTPQKTAATPQTRTLVELKKSLDIDGWRCGAQTLKHTPCKRFVKTENKRLIDAQLKSMTGLTRACPDFESALLELVALVHCYQHDADEPKKCRIKAWRLPFPPGSASQVPVDLRIKDILEPFSVECMGCDDGARCKEKIGGWKVQNCRKTLQQLIKPDVYSDDAKLEFLLKVLEWNRMCSIHQSSEHFVWAMKWKSDIINVLPAPRAPPASTLGITTNPASYSEYWPRTDDQTPFKILEPPHKNNSPAFLHQLIRSKINKPLETPDIRHGYIYAYNVAGNRNYLKIGYTTRSLEARHDEWSMDCNRLTLSLYPPLTRPTTGTSAPAAQAILVPHARRVEALCHAELDHRRIRIDCTACLKQHVEWFHVSAAEAISVIEKWSRWMNTRPYEEMNLRAGSKWALSASEKGRLNRMDLFMRDVAASSTPL